MTELFSTRYIVTEDDISVGAHLGNERALVIFQKGRLDFLQHLGFSDKNIGDNRGIIIVESGVKYHREGFLRDVLLVHVTGVGIAGKKCTLAYSVTRESDGQELLSGFTSFLAFDYQIKKVVELPEVFVEKTGRMFS
ncbi:thioesterase [Desulfopila sp. IMCC35006]|uniref:acyl-CoA thioesterase n=1 Tax=Desulfopila sp. IMCC35006 TaxID=2569542 RepID=UPI0010AB7CA2|nr:thioesterase family protein [Desulfopila sp. IMCC35006]TKB23882.1 thioesterase [Desulfopila sp. IMCC35006]